MVIEANERYDDSHGIEEEDGPRVLTLLDIRAKAGIGGDRERVAQAEWCLKWLAFKRYTTLDGF